MSIYDPSTEFSSIEVGDTVRHSEYGTGEVVEKERGQQAGLTGENVQEAHVEFGQNTRTVKVADLTKFEQSSLRGF